MRLKAEKTRIAEVWQWNRIDIEFDIRPFHASWGQSNPSLHLWVRSTDGAFINMRIAWCPPRLRRPEGVVECDVAIVHVNLKNGVCLTVTRTHRWSTYAMSLSSNKRQTRHGVDVRLTSVTTYVINLTLSTWCFPNDASTPSSRKPFDARPANACQSAVELRLLRRWTLKASAARLKWRMRIAGLLPCLRCWQGRRLRPQILTVSGELINVYWWCDCPQ